MTLIDLSAIKYGVFTLACQKLLEHLPELKKALKLNMQLTKKDYIERFNSSFKEFHKDSKPSSILEAVDMLNGHIMGRIGLIRNRNPAAAKIFDVIADEMRNAARQWCYEDIVEGYHRQGCELACCFYKNSAWTQTQKRLGKRACLRYDYGPSDPDDPNYSMKQNFGFGTAPIAYHEGNNEIIIRFQEKDDFNLYLAYPFLFVHEYTAHIYASDFNNFLFNDGWMLHSADTFLWKLKSNRDPQALSMEQTGIFNDYLRCQIKGAILNGYDFSREFERTISGVAQGKYWAITYELAAFEPDLGRDISWQDKFLSVLQGEFSRNPGLLLRKIKSAPSAERLFSLLLGV